MLHWCELQKHRGLSGGTKALRERPAYLERRGGKGQRRVVKCMAEVDNEVGEKPTKGSSQLEQLEQLGFGSKGSGKKGGKATTVRRPAPERPVIAPSSTEPSQEQVYEQYYVVSLAILFGIIIAMGIALAASGFFPEDIDDLVLKYVYPSFSPTIGVFLLGSSLYGVYKYLGGAKPNS
ncbi:hypothetical protein KFL_001780120 [Klebsormidium nitens]|uniref:Uncharacterized protein n=1 Tax=Klebsormidium nitens TaxID=105231 RepID=A0A1Y1I606_KLENI|nr:hypothetical protein KFL_001780120 [Klebsormidium nitens]|eukprot:GAQ84157.1 hypothetical protein KFL_001780120 [Klebsormidium nitens]